ncbi:hypothetical protein ADUPG1_013775, partial [Aduncisulcus paluster]
INIRLSDSEWKILAYIGGGILIFNIILVPVIIAVLAVTRVKNVGKTIPMMDGLKDGFTWFLVGLLVFRQLLQILVEVVDGGTIQILGIAILLIMARVVFWKFGPFDKSGENNTMIWSFDILVLSYLTLGLGQTLKSTPGGDWLFYIFVGISILFNVIFLILMIINMTSYVKLAAAKKLRDAMKAGKAKLLNINKDEKKDENKPEKKEEKKSSFWKRKEKK